MADRILRERDRALPARLAALETKVRALSLRTWQGAVRTAPYLDSFTPSDPSQSSVMVSLTVPAGRWIILATASVSPTGTLAANQQLVFTLLAYDKETNDVLPDASFDNPSAFTFFATGTVGPVYRSVTLVNDLTHVADAFVVFTCVDTGGSGFIVVEPRLRMLPV